MLHEPAEEVKAADIGSARIEKTINDMVDVMRAGPGVGLAAPQIGVPLQVCNSSIKFTRGHKGRCSCCIRTFVSRMQCNHFVVWCLKYTIVFSFLVCTRLEFQRCRSLLQMLIPVAECVGVVDVDYCVGGHEGAHELHLP